MREHIESLSFLEAFSEPVRDRIVAAFLETAGEVRLQTGTTLYDEGEEGPDHGYILVSGTVAVEKAAGLRRSVRAPALLGEMKQFVENKQRTATVRCEQDCTFLFFDWRRLYNALEKTLSKEEVDAFREGIRLYGYAHFLE